MPADVVILTPGRTGSSLLARTLHGVGYAVGDATARKRDYDTFEDVELIRLNERLLAAAGFTADPTVHFSPTHFARTADLHAVIDTAPFRAYIAARDRRRPWLWKDPRLCATLPFWLPLLGDEVAFVFLRRRLLQVWISANLRRRVEAPARTRAYYRTIERHVLAHLRAHGRDPAVLTVDDLVRAPERFCTRLSATLGRPITPADVHRAADGDVRRLRQGLVDLLKAAAIYAKNAPFTARPAAGDQGP